LQVGLEVVGDATGPDTRPSSNRDQNCRRHRRAPEPVRETTGGYRPHESTRTPTRKCTL
jgi:hypothetical protein